MLSFEMEPKPPSAAFLDNDAYPYHFEVVYPIMQYLKRTRNVTRFESPN